MGLTPPMWDAEHTGSSERATPAGDAGRRVFGVAELTRLIKETIESAFGVLWVEGEVSNLRRPSSGHFYFTLKDEQAQISAVFFRGSQKGLRFQLRDGMLVRACGELTVYERNGNYQIIVRRMEEGGKGALQARFEALKEKLFKEGLFDEARKRPLPLLPQHVGVVTSPTGAAIRDILNIVSRRFPNLHLVIAPVKVQGEGAAQEIAGAIDLMNRLGGFDVLIVGRGGGSLEDLWCFNEEVVARAIARSRIPVISAVGHEIDYTISDFVADVRAPTPSAAAELVVGRKDAFEEKLDGMAQGLTNALRFRVLDMRNRLLAVKGSRVFSEPAGVVKQYLQRLDTAEMRLVHEVRGRLGEGRQRMEDIALRMMHQLRLSHQARAQDVRRLQTQLKALSPLAVLGRGYSITCDEKGRAIRRADDVRQGQRVRTRLGVGGFDAEVTRTFDGGPSDDGEEQQGR